MHMRTEGPSSLEMPDTGLIMQYVEEAFPPSDAFMVAERKLQTLQEKLGGSRDRRNIQTKKEKDRELQRVQKGVLGSLIPVAKRLAECLQEMPLGQRLRENTARLEREPRAMSVSEIVVALSDIDHRLHNKRKPRPLQEDIAYKELSIRWMIRRDMAEVLKIERESFEYHWTEADFLHRLRQRNCIGMVAENDNAVLGFIIYELHRNALNVLNLAVHPDHRHQGVGVQLVRKLTTKLPGQGREFITATVRETNLPAQVFFANRGMEAVRVEREAYQDTAEDAYLMQFSLHGNREEYANASRYDIEGISFEDNY